MKTQYAEIANRMVKAEENFVESIMALGDISKKSAQKVFRMYKKAKLLKRGLWMGRYEVKHGAYLDKKTLQTTATLNEHEY